MTELEHALARVTWSNRYPQYRLLWRGWLFEGSSTGLYVRVGNLPVPAITTNYRAVANFTWVRRCLEYIPMLRESWTPYERVPDVILRIEDPDAYVSAYESWKANQ